MTPRSPGLAARDREIVTLMAVGASDRAIARSLDLAPDALPAVLDALFRKLGLQDEPAHTRRVRAILSWMEAREVSRAGGPAEAL
ncbi:MAG: hypothetical protein JWM31_1701 [Solirubrobacterales bacterium]|nr:hypothetical protein [Solirubrobacterales bacterium]